MAREQRLEGLRDAIHGHRAQGLRFGNGIIFGPDQTVFSRASDEHRSWPQIATQGRIEEVAGGVRIDR
jgi:hypothetical protein